MQSKARTVREYLASLPADRRDALEAVRKVILKNLDKGFEEGMQYGMIGYYVPHSIYPPGYHCDPKQPLPYAGLASQKQAMSLYIGSVYGDSELRSWFESAWRATGKKLDMGKACIRFKRVEDIPLEVVGEVFRRMPLKAYVANYEAQRAAAAARVKKPVKPAKPSKPARGAKKPATKAPPSRSAKRPTKKAAQAPGARKKR